MMALFQKPITLIILVVISVLAGVWTSKMGRPLHTLPFTIHKLTSLGVIIWTGMALYQFFKLNSPMFQVIFAGFIVLCLIGLAITGGFLSFEREFPDYVFTLHKIFSALSIVGSVLVLFFFKR